MNNCRNQFLTWSNKIRTLTSHRTWDTRVVFYPLTHQHHGHEQRQIACLGYTDVAEMMHVTHLAQVESSSGSIETA